MDCGDHERIAKNAAGKLDPMIGSDGMPGTNCTITPFAVLGNLSKRLEQKGKTIGLFKEDCELRTRTAMDAQTFSRLGRTDPGRTNICLLRWPDRCLCGFKSMKNFYHHCKSVWEGTTDPHQHVQRMLHMSSGCYSRTSHLKDYTR